MIPGLAWVAAALLVASVAATMTPSVPMLVAAMIIGIAGRSLGLIPNAASAGLGFASSSLLRAGIVLLGLRLSIQDVSGLGAPTLGVVAATVLVTFFTVQLLGRRLGLTPGLSVLVASGFSICGNSAIASVKEVSRSEEEEVAAAVGVVTLSGTLAVFLLPVVGQWLGLPNDQLGIWAGASVQDTAQVIAAASTLGPQALAIATAVKLTRVLFLAPVVAGVSIARQHADQPGDHAGDDGTPAVRPRLVPTFVVLFLAAMVLRTTGLVPTSALSAAMNAENWVLGAGLVGLGSSVRLSSVRQLGPGPLLLGGFAWATVASVSLLAILALGA